MEMSTTATPSAEFAALMGEEWEARLRRDPLLATYAGDHRYDDRLPGAAEEDHSAWLETLRELRRRLGGLVRAALGEAEQLNHDILTRMLDDEVREHEFHAYRLPLSKAFGFQIDLPDQLPAIAPFDTAPQVESYIARLAEFRRYVREQIEVMRLGLATGYRPPRVTLEGVSDGVRQQVVAEADASPLFALFRQRPPAVADSEWRRLLAEGRRAVTESVVPAFDELARFLDEEYVPGAREEIGADDLPDGRAFYRHRVHRFTSLDAAPEEVHATGRAEVARIWAEMEGLVRAAGFEGGVRAYADRLRGEPNQYASSPEELLQVTALVLKRIDGELPRLFKTLPRTPYGIRPIPEASAPGNTTAYYFPPTGDGTRAGFYYVNLYDLPSRPLYEIEALSLHEAVPGHHLQIALQQELDLPNFRRFGGFTEFVEGWALYAERLGLEMGFYQDPASNFGRLSYEMWRACRLVVDTGIHALGWTRQQAIQFMADHTSSTLLNISNEVDRYIAWPGQALAYKIGELKIRELRARAEAALGTRFDLRGFHDLVLGSGAVPLDVLERMVERWLTDRSAVPIMELSPPIPGEPS